MKLPKLPDSWLFPKTKTFLEKNCQDLSEAQKQVITPIPILGRDNEEIQRIYTMSMRRLNFMYSVPMFAYLKTVKHKNAVWFIYSAYHLYEWQHYLFREHKIILDLSKFITRELAEEVVNKYVKFKITKEENAWAELLKVRKNGKAYFWKISEEVPFKEIK